MKSQTKICTFQDAKTKDKLDIIVKGKKVCIKATTDGFGFSFSTTKKEMQELFE